MCDVIKQGLGWINLDWFAGYHFICYDQTTSADLIIFLIKTKFINTFLRNFLCKASLWSRSASQEPLCVCRVFVVSLPDQGPRHQPHITGRQMCACSLLAPDKHNVNFPLSHFLLVPGVQEGPTHLDTCLHFAIIRRNIPFHNSTTLIIEVSLLLVD